MAREYDPYMKDLKELENIKRDVDVLSEKLEKMIIRLVVERKNSAPSVPPALEDK